MTRMGLVAATELPLCCEDLLNVMMTREKFVLGKRALCLAPRTGSSGKVCQ